MKLTALAVALCLTGCANQEYIAYAAAHAEQPQTQQPLVQIKAQPGQQITGLESITVYAPNNQQGPNIAPPPPNVWARVLETGLGVVGTVAGYHYGGKAAIGIANAIKDGAVAGYSHVQAPQANVSTVNTTHADTTSTSSTSNTSSVAITSETNTTSANTSTANTSTSTSTANSHNPITTTSTTPTK